MAGSISADTLYDFITKQKFVRVDLYDYEEQLKGNFPFSHDFGIKGNPDIIEDLKDFAEKSPGRYKAKCVKDNTHPRNSCWYEVDLSEYIKPENVGQGLESPDQIEKRLRTQIYAELREKEKQAKIAELEERLQDMKGTSEQLAHAGKVLLLWAMDTFGKGRFDTGAIAADLQGTVNGNNNHVDMEQNTDTYDVQTGDADLDHALAIFRRHNVDSAFLLKLAKSVDKNPGLLGTVKTFLKFK